MKENKKKFIYSIYSTHILSLLIFALTLILSCFFVWTHDDYITVGIYDFKSAFDFSVNCGNGRFIGNFLVNFVMCRYIPDRIFRAVFIFGSVLLTALVADGYRKRSILLSSLLYLGIGNTIFRETFVWGHGFYNYIPPITLMLLGIYIIKQYYNNKQAYTPIIAIILGLVGFSQQLFVENCTTINLIIASFIFISVYYKKYKKSPALTYLVANIFGAFIMFAVPEMIGVSKNIDWYRKIDGGIKGYVINFIDNISIISETLNSQLLLWEILSIVLVGILVKKNKHRNKITFLSCVYMIIYPFLTIFYFALKKTIILYMLDIALLIYVFCIIFNICTLYPIKRYKVPIAIIILSILSAGQLVIVKPIASRCLLITYVLLSILTVYLNKKMFNMINSERLIRIMYTFISILCVVIYSILLFVYINIKGIDRERVKYAEEQIKTGTTHIEIINLPYTYFLHEPNESFSYGYMWNQGNRKDMTFSYIDYEDYLAKKK